MFTGIVEALGRVSECREMGTGAEIRIGAPRSILADAEAGASMAVDGACLTLVEVRPEEFTVQVVATTLSRTVAGRYRPGSVVNLERAAAIGDRLDGHFVQGHIDGVGHVVGVRDVGGSHLLELSVPQEVHDSTIPRGSIALNGVSLTVSRLEAGRLVEVALIPHTWGATNLQYLSAGDPLNVEADLIGKYVGKLLRHMQDGLDGGPADAI